MEELWQPIPGFESLYEVSSIGRVRSLPKVARSKNGKEWLRKECLIKLQPGTFGYPQFGMYKNGIYKIFKLHRIVAKTFLPNPENKTDVNHKNGVKTDNRVENLEWCTHQENIIHNYLVLKNGPTTGKFGSLNPASVKIDQYDLKGNFIRSFECIKDAANLLKANRSNIGSAVNGIRNTAAGFLWSIHGQPLRARIFKDGNFSQKNEYNPFSKPVLQIDMNGNIVKTWPSIGEIKRAGISNVGSVLTGRRKQSMGYYWKYPEKDTA